MKAVSIAMLCLALCSCSHLRAPEESGSVARVADEVPAPAPGLVSPADLLVSRQAYCAEPAAHRDGIAGEALENGVTGSIEAADQIERLLRMSCDMRLNYRSIDRILAALRADRSWPTSYLALFDLMQAGADAVKSLEQQRAALQIRLDETIRGITNIEEAIDARRGKNHLAED